MLLRTGPGIKLLNGFATANTNGVHDLHLPLPCTPLLSGYMAEAGPMLKFLLVIGPANLVRELLTRRGIRITHELLRQKPAPTAWAGGHEGVSGRRFVPNEVTVSPGI